MFRLSKAMTVAVGVCLFFCAAVLQAESPIAEADPAQPKGGASRLPLVPPKVWAIVVGIETPGKLPVAGRPFARQDATAFYDMLVNGGEFNASPSRVWLMLDQSDMDRGAVPATAENFRKTMQTIASRAAPEDLIFLFFKGEGLPHESEFRWLFQDADPDAYAKTTILSTEMRELIDPIRQRRMVTFVDACFESPARELKDEQAIRNADWARLFWEMTGPQRIVLSANAAREPCPVDEKAERGLFSLALEQAFEGKDEIDPERLDAWITAGEIWHSVDSKLPKLAAAVVGTEANAKPQVFEDSLSGEWDNWRLSLNPSAAGPLAEQVARLAARNQNKELSDDELAEGTRLLYSLPRSKDERQLRDAYLSYLGGETPIDKLRAVRARAVESRRLDPDAAPKFAQTVLDAYQMIEQTHVSAHRGPQAVAEGIILLLREVGDDVPPKIADSLSRIDTLTPSELKSLLLQVRGYVGKREDLPDPEPLHIVLEGMFESLDPYSEYLNSDRAREMREARDGQFAGIGIVIGKGGEEGLEVLTPLYQSPAFKAGIRAGDYITKIDGHTVAGLPFEKADSLLVGKKGETVKLEVRRPGVVEPLQFDIKRDFVKVLTVLGHHRNADYTWDYWIDKPNRIAYIRITKFADDTASELGEVLRQLRSDGMRGLILDLRYNPGGVFRSAVEVADLFIDQGAIVTEKNRNNVETAHLAHRWGTLRDFQLVVLINRLSASGSELVAAAISDHERGRIVGERSFGKGSKQNIREFENGTSALKLTTTSFHRPNGQNLHRFPNMSDEDQWGVKPDFNFEVPLFREDLAKIERQLQDSERIGVTPPQAAPPVDRDPQLELGLDYLRGKK